MNRAASAKSRPHSRQNRRNARGAFAILALASSLIIILLGALSFDIFSAREQYNQLQAATDAAALAAAQYISNPDNTDDVTTKNIGLTYFRMNRLTSGSLASAKLSDTARSDKPTKGASSLGIAIDRNTSIVTATSAFGLQPSLLKFLGSIPIYAVAKAGPSRKGLTGDVCIVMDLSCSMNLSCGSRNVYPTYQRIFVLPKKLTVHLIRPRTGSVPFLPGTRAGILKHTNATIIVPGSVQYAPPGASPQPAPHGSAPWLSIDDKSPLMKSTLDAYAKAVASPPPGWRVPINPTTTPPTPFTINDVKNVLLSEACAGTLESQALYAPPEAATKASASTSILQFVPGFKPQPGFQAEYQRLALTEANPKTSEVIALHKFVDGLQSKDNTVHWSLVGFGMFSPGTAPKRDNPNHYEPACSTYDPTKVAKYMWPLVPLDQNKDNAEEVLRAADMGTFSWGTYTPYAIKDGIDQLTGPGHRPGKPKTLILLTDGMPTASGSINFMPQLRAKGIKLIIVGYFATSFAWPQGHQFCKNLVTRAGNGAKYYPIGNGRTQLPYELADAESARKKFEEALTNIATQSTSGSGGICLQ